MMMLKLILLCSFLLSSGGLFAYGGPPPSSVPIPDPNVADAAGRLSSPPITCPAPRHWWGHDTSRNREFNRGGRGEELTHRGFANPPHDFRVQQPIVNPTWTHGALSMDRRTWAHMLTEDSIVLSARNFTLALLIRPIGLGQNWMGLITRATNSSNYTHMFAISPQKNLCFYSNSWGWTCSDGQLEGGGGWDHVAVTMSGCYRDAVGYERCTVRFYINGNPSGSDTQFIPGNENTYLPIFVGSWYTVWESPERPEHPAFPEFLFNGDIGETLLWNEAIPSECIAEQKERLENQTLPTTDYTIQAP